MLVYQDAPLQLERDTRRLEIETGVVDVRTGTGSIFVRSV